MRTYLEFYSTIELPFFAPPSWVFGTAWGIIYPLCIVATILIIYRAVGARVPRNMVWLIGANWIANLVFTPVQLGLRPLWPASVVILLVLGTLAAVQWIAWRRFRLVFWLLLPYLIWGVFATVLQLTIMLTN